MLISICNQKENTEQTENNGTDGITIACIFSVCSVPFRLFRTLSSAWKNTLRGLQRRLRLFGAALTSDEGLDHQDQFGGIGWLGDMHLEAGHQSAHPVFGSHMKARLREAMGEVAVVRRAEDAVRRRVQHLPVVLPEDCVPDGSGTRCVARCDSDHPCGLGKRTDMRIGDGNFRVIDCGAAGDASNQSSSVLP